MSATTKKPPKPNDSVTLHSTETYYNITLYRITADLMVTYFSMTN